MEPRDAERRGKREGPPRSQRKTANENETHSAQTLPTCLRRRSEFRLWTGQSDHDAEGPSRGRDTDLGPKRVEKKGERKEETVIRCFVPPYTDSGRLQVHRLANHKKGDVVNRRGSARSDLCVHIAYPGSPLNGRSDR